MSNIKGIDISGYSVELRKAGSLDMGEKGRELVWANQGNIGYATGTSSTYEIPDETKNPITAKEQLQRVDDFIEKHGMELDKADSNYVYLYKRTGIDSKDLINGDFIYKTGKTFATELDRNLYRYGKGIEVCSSIKGIIEPYTRSVQGHITAGGGLAPEDPSDLYKNTYKIFKVKVAKADIIIDIDNKIRVGQVDIIEEIKLLPKLKYQIWKITEIEDGFTFRFEIKNDITGRNIDIDVFNDVIDVPQQEIKDMINNKLDDMQGIFDEFQQCYGEL